MTMTEEIIAILFGTGGGAGLIAIIFVLFNKAKEVYKAEKRRGATTMQAINISIRSINIKKQKNKKL